MKLRELFEQNINRNINGVVQVEQVNDEDILYDELKEFVITKELSKHFSTFYGNYNNSLDEATSKVGVWISGFFGSGKSHFLKILSCLLANKEVKGKRAVEFFENKYLDELTLADIKRAASVPTETVLFNIDSKSSRDSKSQKDGIVEVFLKVFNESLGYSANYPKLADIERYLDKNGKYKEFKQLVTSESGCSSWEKAANAVEFFKDYFIKAYVQITGTTERSTQELFADVVEDSKITPEGFSKLIKEYLESKGTKNRIIFLVDEIGQFISDNSDLMLNLQTIVEDLGSACNGRAWVMVTSQEAIDTITKERFRDQDFSKIQGRFDTKLSLSGANTDEVIKRRLLSKTQCAKPVLGKYYNEQEKILANLITFSSQTAGMEVYKNSEDFIDCYPFIPYQFKLLQNVFSSLRKFSHAGAHLSQNERSMLNAFHNALMEYGEKEVTELVPLNVFYNTIKTFIDTDIVRIIEQAKDRNSDIEDFDIEVLTVLFLIKYIKEVPCDIENLATLMISNINDSKNNLKSRIEASLTRLKRAVLIRQNGDIYDFLTNEEQDVSRGIKNTAIDSGDVLNEVYRTIWEEIYPKKSIAVTANNTHYFTRRVDDIARGSQSEDMEIKFITSMNPDYKLSDNDLKLKCMSNNILYIKLYDNGYLQELETILKTEKYIRQKSGVKQTETQDKILNNTSSEILGRKTRVKTLLEDAIVQSRFLTAGEILDVSATSAVQKIENAFKIVEKNTYANLNDIVDHISSDREIYTKFAAVQTKLSEPNKKALDEILSYLEMNNQMNCMVSMQTLKTRYTKKPYGWALLDIAGLIADLASNNKITINYNGASVNKGDNNIIRYLTNDRDIQNTIIKIKTQIDFQKVNQVSQTVRTVFEKTNLSDDGEKLKNQITDEFIPELVDELKNIKFQYTNPLYPDKDIIEKGIEIFNSLKNEPDTNVLFDKIILQQENLCNWKNDYRLVKSFFGSQKPIFDEALTIYDKVKRNEVYISLMSSPDIDKMNSLVKQAAEILYSGAPYSRIKDLPILCSDIDSIFKTILKDYKDMIGEIISDSAYYLAEEAVKQGLNSEKYGSIFKENVSDLYERADDFGELNAIKEKTELYYKKLLEQINQDCIERQTIRQTSEGTDEEQAVKELEFVNPIQIVNAVKILETEEDVDNYIKKLGDELKSKIRANKRIKLR